MGYLSLSLSLSLTLSYTLSVPLSYSLTVSTLSLILSLSLSYSPSLSYSLFLSLSLALSLSLSFSFSFSIYKSGKRRKTGASELCTMDENCFLFDSDLGPRRLCEEKHVSVKSTVTGCDVSYCATTLQGFNQHPPRVREAVSDSRDVPRCTEKNSQNLRLITCVDRSTRPIHHTRIQRLVQSVTRRHCTICQVSSSQSALFPNQASLWNRSRPSTFVQMSLGFTSVLTDDIVKKFPKYQILNE